MVLDEVAVIARPGAASRRPETETVAAALARYRPLVSIEEPGTLDGGDVLVVGRRVWVGVGGRTNLDGVRQLERHLAPHGYLVRGVETRGCLHLKSAATRVSDSAVLVNPSWVDSLTFSPLEVIEIDRASRSPPTRCWLGQPCSSARPTGTPPPASARAESTSRRSIPPSSPRPKAP